MKEIIARGAESIIYLDGCNLVKERIKKGYRHKDIDVRLRKYRTRGEMKLLEKSGKYIPVPKVNSYSDIDMKIVMEHIDGRLLKDFVDSLSKKEINRIFIQIGKQIAKLHDESIIHGDLTTSNMVMKDKIYFIDFGLGFISNKLEDKAVDLHLLNQALDSKHYKISKDAFNSVLTGYKSSKSFRDVFERLKKVQQRGKYKEKSI